MIELCRLCSHELGSLLFRIGSYHKKCSSVEFDSYGWTLISICSGNKFNALVKKTKRMILKISAAEMYKILFIVLFF